MIEGRFIFMNTTALFTKALGLADPWCVTSTDLKETDDGSKELHIYIEFKKGAHFACPVDGCAHEATAYDTIEHTWRHLNFFQYKTYIHTWQPRLNCPKHKTHLIPVPWAREGSGFTLLFEAMCLEMAKTQPMAQVAKQVDEYDTRLWRFVKHYVTQARELEDYSDVQTIGMDETSKKGHHYITVMADLEKRKVIYVTEGKDHTTVERFVKDFHTHGGISENVSVITCDMSLGFRKGILENFPNAATIIDKFHVIKHANEAVDTVRKEEAKTNPLLKKTKYIWLKNEENLTQAQAEKKQALSKKRLKTGRAYQMRLTLQDIYEHCQSKEEAEPLLKKLTSWMKRSRLESMKAFAGLIRDHWNEILNYFENRYTNAMLEGINSMIQNIKCRSRGFRNDEYFKTMIYLVCGKLDIDAVIGAAMPV